MRVMKRPRYFVDKETPVGGEETLEKVEAKKIDRGTGNMKLQKGKQRGERRIGGKKLADINKEGRTTSKLKLWAAEKGALGGEVRMSSCLNIKGREGGAD